MIVILILCMFVIIVFGEMDVLIIDEMLVGRKVIEIYWVKYDMLDCVFGFVEKEIKKGR